MDRRLKILKKYSPLKGNIQQKPMPHYKRSRKIERALPGSRFGKLIANVEKMTRADVAALVCC